jgi:hypothetical protein
MNVNFRNRYKNESVLFVVFVRCAQTNNNAQTNNSATNKRSTKDSAKKAPKNNKQKRSTGKHLAKKNNEQKIRTKEEQSKTIKLWGDSWRPVIGRIESGRSCGMGHVRVIKSFNKITLLSLVQRYSLQQGSGKTENGKLDRHIS